VQDTSCYTGSPATCPVAQEVCSTFNDCETCSSAGCVFQEGRCKSECEFGPLGDFLAECLSEMESCPVITPEDHCSAASQDCGSCLEAGCAWQGDGKCYDSCLVQDTSCYTGSPTACPTQ